MTEQDNADALDGFPCRQYGAPRSDVTQPEAGGWMGWQIRAPRSSKKNNAARKARRTTNRRK